MRRDLTAACSILRLKVPQVITAFSMGSPDLRLKVVGVERTALEQAELYQHGRTTPGKIVTMLDGIAKKSLHQRQHAHDEDAVHAVDLGVFDTGGTYLTDDAAYEPLLFLAEAHGLFSGARFSFVDRPHVQCRSKLV